MQVRDYTTRFSGHETFPLRYGWLYKAVKEVKNGRKIRSTNKDDIERAVINMGVGKNMVSSIKYWADVCRIIETNNGSESLTKEGKYVFGGDTTGDQLCGVDPYMENPATVWLIHWLINSDYKELSATRWFFNYFNGQRFDKKQLLKALLADLERRQLSNFSEKTIEKDIDCLLQTYTHRVATGQKITEDSFSSPLTELGLLHSGEGKSVRAELCAHQSLPKELFAFCLIQYWKTNFGNVTTVSFDNVLSSPGSPARVFRLSQSALGDLIDATHSLTDGSISWTDTQGLRGVFCKDINILDEYKILDRVYKEA
ncbi:DUF4007 family protein [Pontibacterium sp. N1Y112]|uniref:DUF4007 family protein n=1 Tax=Pontibacterium sinense TaxID=2781979 RepID=A0A8J7FCA7_9GAMM|nr:DUF4007 family protein [Pontibacterium sinense]